MDAPAYNSDAELGMPALICRWSLWERCLPMEQRHLRALSRRIVSGKPVAPELIAWAKEHIDWTLFDGAAKHPSGTLMLMVDTQGRAAMTIGPKPTIDTTVENLEQRAQDSLVEAQVTGVAPELLWKKTADQVVYVQLPQGADCGATNHLLLDILRTLGHKTYFVDTLTKDEAAELFLVSDEHGVVAADGYAGDLSRELQQDLMKLFALRAKEQKDSARRV